MVLTTSRGFDFGAVFAMGLTVLLTGGVDLVEVGVDVAALEHHAEVSGDSALAKESPFDEDRNKADQCFGTGRQNFCLTD